MKFVKQLILIIVLCVVYNGSAAVTHWWFYPEGRPPSGMPGPGVDRTNIALEGWADTQVDANKALHAFGLQSIGQSATNVGRRLPVNLMFNVTEAYKKLPEKSPIAGAELYVRVCAAATAKPAIAFSLYPVQTRWNEITATWVSPWTKEGGDFGPELDSVECGSPDAWRYITVDVTEPVKYEYAHSMFGTSTYGIAMKDISGACPYVFTRQTLAEQQRPYLHIMIPEPVAAWMAIILLTIKAYRRRSQ